MKFSNSIFVKVCTLAILLSFSSLLMAQEKSEPIDSSFWYRITNMWKGDNLALDIVDDGQCNCKLKLATPGKIQGQYWRFKHVREGWYRVFTRFQKSTKCLDIVNDSPQLGERGKRKSQLWRLVPDGSGYYQLYAKSEGEKKVLDVKNDGRNTVFMGNSQGVSGQFWKLTKIKQRGGKNAKNQTQANDVSVLKVETRKVEQPAVEIVPKNRLTKGTQLFPRTLPSNWWAMKNPLTLQTLYAVVIDGKTLVPANSNMHANISKNNRDEYFLELIAVEVGGTYLPIKTNKVKINNTDDLFSPYLGSEANFEVPVETSIPIVLEENVDLE